MPRPSLKGSAPPTLNPLASALRTKIRTKTPTIILRRESAQPPHHQNEMRSTSKKWKPKKLRVRTIIQRQPGRPSARRRSYSASLRRLNAFPHRPRSSRNSIILFSCARSVGAACSATPGFRQTFAQSARSDSFPNLLSIPDPMINYPRSIPCEGSHKEDLHEHRANARTDGHCL